ncbi:uncharacterized protein LOC119647182 [Hermetia illucens]|uniref:uncharacterized protein LOC119647182 n=1 Tax=Hermetia illucens TaxID=343691 RepID=UPI0018CC1305|nr:uncharacterized protein LOC119647182 [Hermetia illucens]
MVERVIRETNVCKRNFCNIACNGGSSSDVSSFLKNQSDSGLLCSFNNKLTIQETEFPNATLMEGWLVGDYFIAELTILNTNIETIEQSAFNSSCFTNLTSLEISHANIHYFPKGILAPLHFLEDLILDNSVKELSPEYLEGVTSTIRSLKVSGITTRNKPNSLFGILPLPKLGTLDLRYDNFGDTIEVDTFENATPTGNLFLPASQISFLPVGIFDSFRKGFQNLDLRNNNLIEVSGEVFEPLIPLYIILKIRLGGNPWDCTYKLSQLAELIEQNTRKFEGPFICASPPELTGKNLSSSILPAPPSTTTEETTEISIEITTTNCGEKDLSLAEFICKNDIIGDNDVCMNMPNQPEAHKILLIKKMDASFNISRVSCGSVQISINATEGNFTILWFRGASKNRKEVNTNSRNYCLGCANLDSQNIVINHLDLGELYTFCVIKDNRSNISPLNCRSYFVDYECNGECWILHQSQTITIGSFAACALLVAFFGALVMFWIIHCNPTLLKGCEWIVVVNKNAVDVVVQPKGKKKKKSKKHIEITSIKREQSVRLQHV